MSRKAGKTEHKVAFERYAKSEVTSVFMQAAENLGDRFPNFGNVAPSILYALAAPSTPETVRDQVETRAVAGEKITVADLGPMRPLPGQVRGIVFAGWITHRLQDRAAGADRVRMPRRPQTPPI